MTASVAEFIANIRPKSLQFDAWRVASVMATVAAIIFLLSFYAGQMHGSDAMQWYTAELDDGLYAKSRVDAYGYVYSPAFAQLMQPLQLLPWGVFFLLLLALEMGSLVWLAGSLIAVILLAGQFSVLWDELRNLNINLLIGVAVWAGFRHPWAWSCVLLTKVTPGIGLLWFVVRREWRDLTIALGVTVLIVAVSFLFVPDLWFQWLGVLFRNVGVADEAKLIPLWVRWPAAVAIVVIGARRNQPWTVAAAAILASATISTMPWLIGLGVIRWYVLDSHGSVLGLRRERAADSRPNGELTNP